LVARAALTGLVEVVHLRLTELSPEVQLMSALGPGQVFVQVASDVIAARGSRDAQRVEAVAAGGKPVAGLGGTNHQVGRAGQIRRRNAGI